MHCKYIEQLKFVRFKRFESFNKIHVFCSLLFEKIKNNCLNTYINKRLYTPVEMYY